MNLYCWAICPEPQSLGDFVYLEHAHRARGISVDELRDSAVLAFEGVQYLLGCCCICRYEVGYHSNGGFPYSTAVIPDRGSSLLKFVSYW